MTTESIMAMGGAVLEECAGETCIMTIGRAIDAEYVVRGSLSKFQTRFTLDVEMFETDFGNLVATADPVRSTKLDDILDKTAEVCAVMFKSFLGTGTQAPTPTQTPAPMPTPDAPQSVLTPSSSSPAAPPRELTDPRDGKKYKTVVMPDGKTWMAENLNYQTGNSWCYGNDNANCAKYGRLYDWNTARNACPAGWHLPSAAEWTALINAVGGASKAGTKLKTRTGWQSKSGVPAGTDEYGFSALPGGRYRSGIFLDVGDYGLWWTVTESDATDARYRYMHYNIEDVYSSWGSKYYGFSVRCVARVVRD